MKRHYQFHLPLAALLLCMAASCGNDGDLLSYENHPGAVRIRPSVRGTATATRTTPDTDENTLFQTGNTIAVGRDGANALYTYEKTADGWTPTGSGFLLWNSADEQSMALQACYPATAGLTDFALPAVQNSADAIATADFMTYRGTALRNADDNSVSFTLKRHTARVRVTIDGFGDQYDAATATCDVTVVSPHTTVSVAYAAPDASSADYTPTATGAGTALSVTPLGGTAMTVGSTATALVAPSDAADSDATFLLVTVKTSPTETHPLTVKGIPAHRAGYSYDYSLTVGKDEVVVNSVLVKPWNDPIVVEGGQAKEVKFGPDATTHTITTEKAGQIS